MIWVPWTRQWRRMLRASGLRLVERFWLDYPDPAKLFWKVHPAVAHLAFRRLTRQAVHQSIRVGVLTAACLYDGRRGAQFGTAAALHMRSAVQKELNRRREHEPEDIASLDLIDANDDQLQMPAVPDVVVLDDPDWWRLATRDLTAREMVVIDLRYRHGRYLRVCGEIMGISHERVRQLEVNAIQKMRANKFLLREAASER